MRRKDREVARREELVDILRRCDTLRIGMRGGEYPYVVPVSFGMDVEDGKPVVFFHCARQGMKLELLREHPAVCVEGDIFHRVEPTAAGITARYESVIGYGTCRLLDGREDILRGLKAITDHYGYDGYPLDRCRGLDHLYIGKVVLDRLTGKRNLPEPPAEG